MTYTIEQLRSAEHAARSSLKEGFAWPSVAEGYLETLADCAADHLKHMETECCRGLAPDSECRCALEAKPEGDEIMANQIKAPWADEVVPHEELEPDGDGRRRFWLSEAPLIRDTRPENLEAKPEGEKADEVFLFELIGKGVAEQVEEEKTGFWRHCTGCIGTENPYSKIFKCELGMGCRECGGLGAIWDDADYEQMAKEMLSESRPTKPEGEKDDFAEFSNIVSRIVFHAAGYDETNRRHTIVYQDTYDAVMELIHFKNPSRPAPEGYALVPIDERADDILLSLSLNRISVDEAKAAMIAAAQEKEVRG